MDRIENLVDLGSIDFKNLTFITPIASFAVLPIIIIIIENQCFPRSAEYLPSCHTLTADFRKNINDWNISGGKISALQMRGTTEPSPLPSPALHPGFFHDCKSFLREVYPTRKPQTRNTGRRRMTCVGGALRSPILNVRRCWHKRAVLCENKKK